MQDGGDARQALHRLASSNYDGQSQSAGELMPHSALQRCLDMWVPALVDECDFAAAFLLLYRPVEEAHAAPGKLPIRRQALPSIDLQLPKSHYNKLTTFRCHMLHGWARSLSSQAYA